VRADIGADLGDDMPGADQLREDFALEFAELAVKLQ
jgi:hypothetical protein